MGVKVGRYACGGHHVTGARRVVGGEGEEEEESRQVTKD